MSEHAKLLEIRELVTVFDTDAGELPAMDGISFSLDRRETLGMVGESGCGKSVTALSVMGYISPRQGRVAAGEILFEGNDLARPGNAEMRKIRGNRIFMIFQEPMTSLNPVFTIGDQIMEAIMLHRQSPETASGPPLLSPLQQAGAGAASRRNAGIGPGGTPGFSCI